MILFFVVPLAVGAWLVRKGRPVVAVALTAFAFYAAPSKAWWTLGIQRPYAVPDFHLADVRGGPSFRLSEERGRPVVLFLWATWCPHIGSYLPMLNLLSQKFEASHVRFVAVNYENIQRPKLLDFAKSNNLYPAIYDGWNARYFPLWDRIKAQPTILLIDRRGRLKEVVNGTTQEELDKKILDLAFDDSPESRLSLAEIFRRNGRALASDAPDGPEVWAAESANAESLLLGGRLDDLEARASQLRTERSRFSDGGPRLSKFYDGLSLKDTPDDADPDPFLDRIGRLEAWISTRPASVTPRIALVKTLHWWAWRARGSDYGVRDRDKFERRLNRAKEAAENAAAIPEKDPELWAARINLARGLGQPRKEVEAMFAEAVAFDPVYERSYQAMGRYLSPRWYGEPGEWEAFAERQAVERQDAALYALIIAEQKEFLDDQLFKKTSVSWPRMREGFVVLQKRYPDSRYLRGVFASYACAAGDKEMTRTLFASGFGPASDAWQGYGRYERCRGWAEGEAWPTLSRYLGGYF